MYAQAYFDYDSKKSGGVTMSHLRFGKKPIKSTYLIHKANFVACHNPSYVNKYNMVQELVDGGTFLLNCSWDMEGLEKHLPGQVKPSSLITTSNSTQLMVSRSVKRSDLADVSIQSFSQHSSNWHLSFRKKKQSI